MIIIISLITAILAGILYRMGGSSHFNTKYRDMGVPLVICLALGHLGGLNSLWKALSLLLCFPLMWASLTTYRYFLPKPKDYLWYHYALHGFFVSLAMFPYVITSGNWLGFGVRVVTCTVAVGLWSHLLKWDVGEEFGRGALFGGTTFMLLI